MYFRGIDTTDAAILSIALNATNHTIELTINVNALASALPQATTTQKGVGETATDAEAQAKASIVNFVTPSNFAAMDASTTFAGFIEIATDAEAIAGLSTTLAITPANLKATIGTYGTTVTFADAVAKAAAVPAFKGQLGSEQDNITVWVGQDTVAGQWNPLLVLGGVQASINQMSSTTVVDLGGVNFEFSSVAPGGSVDFDLSMTAQFFGTVNFDGATFQIGTVTVPANSVIVTDGIAGNLSHSLIATFLSSANVQTGYTAFTNPATIRTCNTATVTLQQLAQIVGTLIEDVKAIKLPAT